MKSQTGRKSGSPEAVTLRVGPVDGKRSTWFDSERKGGQTPGCQRMHHSKGWSLAMPIFTLSIPECQPLLHLNLHSMCVGITLIFACGHFKFRCREHSLIGRPHRRRYMLVCQDFEGLWIHFDIICPVCARSLPVTSQQVLLDRYYEGGGYGSDVEDDGDEVDVV